MKEVADLRPGHAIAVRDYVMKLVFRRLYELRRSGLDRRYQIFEYLWGEGVGEKNFVFSSLIISLVDKFLS